MSARTKGRVMTVMDKHKTPQKPIRTGRDDVPGRIPLSLIEEQRQKLHDLRQAAMERGRTGEQTREQVFSPLLAWWVAKVRDQDRGCATGFMGQDVVTQREEIAGGKGWEEEPRRAMSGISADARTAVALEEDLALRDAFLLAAVTDLPPRRLLQEVVDPFGEPARRDVRDTFGRGLRTARYRQPQYTVRACDLLIAFAGRLPAPWAGQPLAMLSLLLWWRHQGDQALGAAALAVSQRPGNALARLVVTAIEAGVFPQEESPQDEGHVGVGTRQARQTCRGGKAGQ